MSVLGNRSFVPQPSLPGGNRWCPDPLRGEPTWRSRTWCKWRIAWRKPRSGEKIAWVPITDPIFQDLNVRAGNSIVNCVREAELPAGLNRRHGVGSWHCVLRRRDDVAGRGKVTGEKESIISQDLADIVAGFGNRRKSSVTIDDMLPGVIGSERQWKVATESVE